MGDTYDITTRDYSAEDHNAENTVDTQLNSKLIDNVYGMVGGSYSVRTAKNYDGNLPWVYLNSNDVIQNTTYAQGNLDLYGLTHYSEAARDRTELKSSLTWSPQDAVNVAITTKYDEDHYPDSPYGITNDHSVEINPDVSYQLSDSVTTHAFYSFEQTFYDLNDAIVGTCTGSVSCPVTWQLGTKNDVHTAGFTGDWKVTSAFKIGLSYVFQYGATGFNENDQVPSALTGTTYNYTPLISLPTDRTALNSLTLHGDYDVMKNISVRLGYTFERFSDLDYLNSQAVSDPTAANFVLPGTGIPTTLSM